MKIELQEEISDRLYESALLLPGYNLYHTRSWHELLTEAFGWRVNAVTAWDDAAGLVGFLPFVRKHRFLGKATVCLPLSHAVGPLVHAEHPALADELCRFLGSIEIHSPIRGGAAGRRVAGFVETSAAFDGTRDPEVFRARLSKNMRRDIRDAQKAGVTVEEGVSPDLFAAFSLLQSMTRRRQGSPDYPARFFPAMGRIVGSAGLARVHLALLGGQPAAGVISLNDPGGAVYYYGYGASRAEAQVRHTRVNQIALWSAIAHACREGARRFSFGSSPLHQESLWRYKERFGGETVPLEWTVYGHRVSAISTDGLLARIGSPLLKLAPMPLFRSLSPLLLREVV